MTGPEHYIEAERLLAGAQTMRYDDEARSILMAEAQVHAALALTAAQIDVVPTEALDKIGNHQAWGRVTGQ